MKKLALVLGSLLVIGSVASAKEVMPAPAMEPEVKVVEKPVEVVVYRDRVVQAPAKWRPNGAVSVTTKTVGEIESTKSTDKRTWDGADPKTRLEVKGNLNFTEKQNLEFRLRDWYGLTHRNNGSSGVDEYYLQHTYNFGTVFGKVNMALESRFQRNDSKVVYNDDEEKYSISGDKFIRERVAFDFADYLFQNDYIKTTKAVLAPEFKYAWGTWTIEDKVAGTTESFNNHYENYGLYADYQADIIGGFSLEVEFDDLLAHTVYNNPYDSGKDVKGTTGSIEITLERPVPLYTIGKHEFGFNPKLVYATNWAYNKKTVENGLGGTLRANDKKENWGTYTATFEPQINYTYKATEYVDINARLAAEYVNRDEARHSASHWRWQPYAELGMKVTF